MKRVLLGLSLFAGAVALPQLVSAKAVEDVMLSADPQDIVLTVVADESLHAPTIRTYAGSVRIRFYDARDTPLLRLVGDGGAVRSVDISEGSDKSAAVVMMLGDRTRLAPADVRVERAGPKTVLRIARGLLPALREGSPMPVAHAVAPKPAARPAAVASAPAPAPISAQPSPVPIAQPVAAPVAQPLTEPKAASPAATLGVKAVRPDSKEGLRLASGESSSAVPVLISLTALLALAYGALRMFMKKKEAAGTDIPVINVIAQKSLGPRHQLVIVRAFDRDYLLSIQGGQTTVVARSSRSKRIAEAEKLLSPIVHKRATPSTPSRAFEEDDEVTFGGELFKTALEQRERAREQTAGFRLEAARAEARAELARLDGARQDFALQDFARQEASRNEANKQPEQPREEERSVSGIVDSTPDAMSDSVSGLLRLRKATGR